MAAICCWCGTGLDRVTPDVIAESPWVCPTRACMDRQLKWSVIATQKGKPSRGLYVPLPRQVQWHEAVYDRQITRLLVGGAAGPGKSKWLREMLYRFAQTVPGFHGLLLRRTHKDLDQSHLRFVPYEVAQRGGVWKASDRVVEFAHPGKPAAIIRMGHLEDSGALQNYLSAEYDCIAPDELVTFQKDEMLELFSRARSSNPTLKALRGGFEYWDTNEDGEMELMETDGSLVAGSTNPGGRGAQWIFDFFIDKAPDPEEHPHYKPQFWASHDARVKDNPYISRGYLATLKDLPEMRRRQLMDGDWHAHEGQFFDFRKLIHVADLGIAA